NGFVVLIPRYGIEGIVYSSSDKAKKVSTDLNLAPLIVYNSHNNCLESVIDGKVISIKLFDKVVVQISVNEDLIGGGEGGMRQKLKMELVQPFLPGLSVSNNNSGSLNKANADDNA
ncbi:9706_t:CDS:2, partial [Funneliformis mosseae]